ncbi:hypothetical protein L3Q82_009559 [Scortum barcoo]|uniref:Uncharacterized protein n=1 Tax=Scortum barcoo TaxID=214431 RepID=A0ACB8WGK3_9TELE|nr:hypothetical protein L3Q82_009559 [Scortum barcoo]
MENTAGSRMLICSQYCRWSPQRPQWNEVARQGNVTMAAMDNFTKWPEAFAIPDQETETVANALMEGCLPGLEQQRSFTGPGEKL